MFLYLVSSANVIPKCCMAHSQLSFHGHRDAVKFFVSVPMSPLSDFPLHISKSDMLVMSGGEGYIDFRLGMFLFYELIRVILIHNYVLHLISIHFY